VVKQALVEAYEGSQEDQAVARSCFAVLLFATPNRGLNTERLMTMAKGQPNEDLVKSLDSSSRFLGMLQREFEKFSTGTPDGPVILSIYETRKTPTVQWSEETASYERNGDPIMMVSKPSAIHASRGEKDYNQIPIDADHSDIVKFSDPSDAGYGIIESRMRELVARAPGVIKERFSSHKSSECLVTSGPEL
jgi:hypothetical protein